jgi:DNA-binding NtrC family response regulator
MGGEFSESNSNGKKEDAMTYSICQNSAPESPMREHPSTIHVVCNNSGESEKIESHLRREGFSVRCFPDGESFLAASHPSPDIILLGIALPGIGSLETLARINNLYADSRVILLSDHERAEFCFRAMRLGAHGVVLEPYAPGHLCHSIQDALNTKNLLSEIKRLKSELRIRHDFKEIVGSSPVLCKMMDDLRRMAENNLPVLFRGENGTGKELAARTLHYNSQRFDEPFFTINCAVLRKESSLDEVFAPILTTLSRKDRKPGSEWQRHQGGTLFLDEIGDMDPALRIKLLGRIGPDGNFRVSSSGPTIGARLFFSVRTDPRDRERAERVISSLSERFALREINIPPLRDRMGDIEPLVKHFLSEFETGAHGLVSRVSREALEVLGAYGWPGNIRELKNIIRQASLMNAASPIDLGDLPPSIRTGAVRTDDWAGSIRAENKVESKRGEPAAEAGEPPPIDHPPREEKPVLNFSLRETEKRQIRRALDHTDGNLSRAASLLGISRSALYRRLEKLGISR